MKKETGKKIIEKEKDEKSLIIPIDDKTSQEKYPETQMTKTEDIKFPIIGMGASAGGLEAFELFLKNLRSDCGMAFIIIIHLDPDRDSLLTEILQRSTRLPVIEAKDQMVVEINHIYIIPPNRDIAIFHGTLQLTLPEKLRGQRMPIDFFFRSLAEEQEDKSICVILSGSGTDGTLGLRAIHGVGGVSFVQEPTNAKYDGMPSSAIRSHLATYILPVEKIPDQILNYVKTLYNQIVRTVPLFPSHENSIKKVMMLLRSKTGHDFSLYKQSTIQRRIARRIAINNIKDADFYVRYLQENPGEVKQLFKELLINVTSFFRDPEAFETLQKEIFPLLLEHVEDYYIFRIWVPACATGEEAYSIAMILREYMDEIKREFKIQIYATDIDEDSIETARTGLYPANIALDVSPERLRRFFIKEDTRFRIKKEVREMIVFATQNVTKDPPFTKIDFLSCRNLLIYLDIELQNKLILSFHYALKSNGILFLGPSESIGNSVEHFTSVNRKWKFYSVKDSIAPVPKFMTTEPMISNKVEREANQLIKDQRETNFGDLTKRALLKSFAPVSVVTDEKGNIFYIYGDTGKYLRPAQGNASLNIIDMARDGLQSELRNVINKAVSMKKDVVSKDIMVKTNGGRQPVSVNVKTLSESEVMQNLLLISFNETGKAPKEKPISPKQSHKQKQSKREEELEQELLYIKENLQAIIEEHQASIEELKSTNEELQSTNEELQSTNEELETSKEELQSVNEELMTVNSELQSKIEQLTEIQNDMKNILDNTNSGIVILNENFTIKRFNRESDKVFRFLATDVGRPLNDIKSQVENIDLVSEAKTVLDSLIPHEIEVFTTNNTWYAIRIMPYRTLDNVIEGVVLIFSDITDRKKIENSAIEAREFAESIVDTIREPLIIMDGELKIISASKSFYKTFNLSSQEVDGNYLNRLGNRQWDLPILQQLLKDILLKNTSFENVEVDDDFPIIGHRKMLLNGRRILGKTGSTELILLAFEDITDIK